eukprot:TRINITY_DN21679_c0_g1_i1.p1 TRINITY_DN21679_c0_g1~~TRINITY_DN21679_c0_g1_i1.p1  ORF type:complete len:250 (-),score=-2.86 TRINITY_DN21679_c0_g1_i1:84-809(-)
MKSKVIVSEFFYTLMFAFYINWRTQVLLWLPSLIGPHLMRVVQLFSLWGPLMILGHPAVQGAVNPLVTLTTAFIQKSVDGTRCHTMIPLREWLLVACIGVSQSVAVGISVYLCHSWFPTWAILGPTILPSQSVAHVCWREIVIGMWLNYLALHCPFVTTTWGHLALLNTLAAIAEQLGNCGNPAWPAGFWLGSPDPQYQQYIWIWWICGVTGNCVAYHIGHLLHGPCQGDALTHSRKDKQD